MEFTDGSVWGQDFSQSAQQLAGVKAGVKAGQEYLKENGIEAALKAIDESDISPPTDQTSVWKRGFKSGFKSLTRQVSEVYKKQGTQAAEAELQRQFFSQTDK